AVELHQLALELEEGAIVAGRIVFGHWVVSYRARLFYLRENTATRTRARRQPIAPPITAPFVTPIPVSITWPIIRNLGQSTVLHSVWRRPAVRRIGRDDSSQARDHRPRERTGLPASGRTRSSTGRLSQYLSRV